MKNNLYVIVGMGLSGYSCARYLQAHNLPFAMLDTRENHPQLEKLRQEFPNALYKFGALDHELLAQASTIVLSPSIALSTPIIKHYQNLPVPIIGDIELFAQHVQAPVIAITGTNAKSTVTTLVGKMAERAGKKVAVGGNLGTPALDLLLTNPEAEVFVLELSSFQLETTYSLEPAVATILNITPDHMDRYATYADYIAAKQRIYKNAACIVWNKDDPVTDCNDTRARKINFTLSTPAADEFGLLTQDDQNYLAHGNNKLMNTADLPIIGKHYQANALAALAIGSAFGLPMPAMLDTLLAFKGLDHRCQFVCEENGVKWYNDSKGTNVGATQAAIEGIGSEIKGKLILIAGGVGKNADFTTLLPALQRYCRHIVLIGEAAPLLSQVLSGHIPHSFAHDMRDAVVQANTAATKDDCVLLSPACASLDMYRNFAHRGEVFVDMVKKEIMQ